MFKFFKSKLKKVAISLKKFSIGRKLKTLFSKKPDESLFEELEKLFYESDLGVKISLELTDKVRDILKKDPETSSDEILKVLKGELLNDIIEYKETEQKKPHVIMIVGVNGSGKTTSIAKVANFYERQGKKVLLIAADTYRAAAVDQLASWAEKANVDIVKSKQGSDPSSVVFDGLRAAINRDVDIVIIDTAGRLHTKTNLMQELEKIRRVSNKVIENSPHETLLVVDATSGQNGVDGAKIFNSYTPITSIFLTKLDGTAKGGIVISIQKEIKVPIQWIGLGESLDDITAFDAKEFIDDLLSTE
ncbi:MAG: Signal recognition particle receptor FtsY [Candidatus Anoxychlamydiales bacterium]|nr:Signal recognition particle receptor FtsY [Candidatus Anoxychlamydiales bacterium]NGX41384.1 Signal recognition particle receptor FtsY [Candidatus Anoxychlamydiales bacterium]HEU64614.1 signal recognition particle-docking protein FtsY [Chlamydiota bacterium]